MKIPKTGSIADKICLLILKKGPQQYSEIVAAMALQGHKDGSTSCALRHARSDLQLDHDGERYLLTDSARRYYNTLAPTAPYKGEIVPPRQAPEFRPIQPKNQFWNALRR